MSTNGSSAVGAMASHRMSTGKQVTVAFTKEIDMHNCEFGFLIDIAAGIFQLPKELERSRSVPHTSILYRSILYLSVLDTVFVR